MLMNTHQIQSVPFSLLYCLHFFKLPSLHPTINPLTRFSSLCPHSLPPPTLAAEDFGSQTGPLAQPSAVI